MQAQVMRHGIGTTVYKDVEDIREFITIDVETNKDSNASSNDETIVGGSGTAVNKGAENTKEFITFDVETNKDSDTSPKMVKDEFERNIREAVDNTESSASSFEVVGSSGDRGVPPPGTETHSLALYGG